MIILLLYNSEVFVILYIPVICIFVCIYFKLEQGGLKLCTALHKGVIPGPRKVITTFAITGDGMKAILIMFVLISLS